MKHDPKFPLTGVKTINANFEVLRPLLRSLPGTQGEVLIPGVGGICIECGARDKHIMIRKHRKNCPHIAWFRAIDALEAMVGPEKKRGKKQWP